MANKAYITPKVLKWARTTAKISEETAAEKVHVPVEKLQKWESGISQPTIAQAQTLAKAYRRPFALLFLPDIPFDFMPLQDFRKRGSKPLSTASVFIIREIQEKQAWISEVNKENKEDKFEFVGKFSVKDDPAIVAQDILETLNLRPGNYKTQNPLKEWIGAAESNGIFISQASSIHNRLKLDVEEFQGFAIADPYAPFIFINRKDWKAPRLFTLVHELAHIWIAESGISNSTDPEIKKNAKFSEVELFCNKVAANALMPDDLIKRLNQSVFQKFHKIEHEAKLLGVSSFAFLVRIFNLNLINLNQYQQFNNEADIKFQEFLEKLEEKKAKEKKSNGGPDTYLLKLNKNSRLFTQLVIDAYHGGYVEPNQASFLLGTPVNTFNKLEALLN